VVALRLLATEAAERVELALGLDALRSARERMSSSKSSVRARPSSFAWCMAASASRSTSSGVEVGRPRATPRLADTKISSPPMTNGLSRTRRSRLKAAGGGSGASFRFWRGKPFV
jgi:hypothetical protein